MAKSQAWWLLASHLLCGTAQRSALPLSPAFQLDAEEGDVARLANQLGRRLAPTICDSPAQPLLWRVQKGTQTSYIVGSYATPLGERTVLARQVTEALGCADAAYFEVPCSGAGGAASGVGNYMAHCTYYPVAAHSDAVALRLSSQEVADLQTAMKNLISVVPAECAGLTEKLSASMRSLSDTNFRTTLLTVYDQAIRALNPSGCTWESKQGTYEEHLRSVFGSTRPVFGLEDVDVQCQAFQGNTIEMDRTLARQMTAKFSNTTWVQQTLAKQDAMTKVLNCGDLDLLLKMPGALPVAGEQLRSQRNIVLAKGIEFALSQNPGKMVVSVVGVGALVNRDDARSVPVLLTEAGFTVSRVRSSEELVCAKSKAAAPGAEQLGRCLTPIGQAQPASCDNFAAAFKDILGKDELRGRWKSDASCGECVKSDQKCTCQIQWGNVTAFRQLCESTRLDGVSGRVLEMDLTRNPGSIRTGPGNAEKTVQSIYQNCYATSCQIPLLEEAALRNWYKTDASLDSGIVTLRPPGAAPVSDAQGFSAASWPWWVWAAGAIALALILAALIACFLIPRRSKRKASSQGWDAYGQQGFRELPTSLAATKPALDEELMPLRGPPPINRDITPPVLPPHLIPPTVPSGMAPSQGIPPTTVFPTPASPSRARGQMASYDNALLMQALQMQQSMNAQGTQVVQQMQMGAFPGMQGGGSPTSGTQILAPAVSYGDPRYNVGAGAYGYAPYGRASPPGSMYTMPAMQGGYAGGH